MSTRIGNLEAWIRLLIDDGHLIPVRKNERSPSHSNLMQNGKSFTVDPGGCNRVLFLCFQFDVWNSSDSSLVDLVFERFFFSLLLNGFRGKFSRQPGDLIKKCVVRASTKTARYRCSPFLVALWACIL